MQLKVKRMHPRAVLPKYMTDGAGGMDLTARESDEGAVLYVVGAHARVPTGIAVEIPTGYVGFIRGRSSLPGRGVFCVEGTVDSDYRGEIYVQLHGEGVVRAGERIAQLVLIAAPRFAIVESDELSETVRAAGGFGSTGST